MIEFEYTGKNPPMRIRLGKLQIDNEHLESVECRVRQDGGYSSRKPFTKGWHEGQVEVLQALLKLRGKKVVSLDPELLEILHGLMNHYGYHNEEEEYLCGRLGGIQDVFRTLIDAYKHLKHMSEIKHEQEVDQIIAESKQLIKNADDCLNEVKAINEGIAFLLNEYKTNKRYFREDSGHVTTADVIKTVFEFGWASRRNYEANKSITDHDER